MNGIEVTIKGALIGERGGSSSGRVPEFKPQYCQNKLLKGPSAVPVMFCIC
jgi:hypothetical protein